MRLKACDGSLMLICLLARLHKNHRAKFWKNLRAGACTKALSGLDRYATVWDQRWLWDKRPRFVIFTPHCLLNASFYLEFLSKYEFFGGHLSPIVILQLPMKHYVWLKPLRIWVYLHVRKEIRGDSNKPVCVRNCWCINAQKTLCVNSWNDNNVKKVTLEFCFLEAAVGDIVQSSPLSHERLKSNLT